MAWSQAVQSVRLGCEKAPILALLPSTTSSRRVNGANADARACGTYAVRRQNSRVDHSRAISSVEERGAGTPRQQAEKALKERCFSCSVWSEHGKDAAAVEAEIHALQNAFPIRVVKGTVANFDLHRAAPFNRTVRRYGEAAG